MSAERRSDATSAHPIQMFFAKAAIVTGASLVVLYFVFSLIASFIIKQAEGLSGGAAFWASVEQKLYALADAPDLPPEKKERIIRALHQLSLKYRPYLVALTEDDDPAKPPHR
jgi:hypothetical protein